MIYEKKATTIQEQISILLERGLHIDNEAFATHHLSHKGYYRLAGYWWPMQADKTNHKFKPNSKFQDVIALYEFDQELRLLLFDIIEKIEISLRTKMIYHLSLNHDPWWFQNITLFSDSIALIKTLAAIHDEFDRSKDVFITEHKKKYKDDSRFPPAWKTLEIASFGNLSKLYGNIKNTVKEKDVIANEYGAVNHTYLPSWLQSIAQIRNYCAHHSRIWNRNLPGAPKILSKPPDSWLEVVPTDSQKLYLHMCLMKYLLNRIQPENQFTSRLRNLLDRYPNVDPHALGMKEKWDEELLWK